MKPKDQIQYSGFADDTDMQSATMSNPNPDRDERVAAPERIYIHPTSAEYHLNKWPLEESEYVGYVRFDIAATRMRDRCVDRVKEYLRHAKNVDIAPLIGDLQSLTLEGEQEKR